MKVSKLLEVSKWYLNTSTLYFLDKKVSISPFESQVNVRENLGINSSQVPESVISAALTRRTLSTQGEIVVSALSPQVNSWNVSQLSKCLTMCIAEFSQIQSTNFEEYLNKLESAIRIDVSSFLSLDRSCDERACELKRRWRVLRNLQ